MKNKINDCNTEWIGMPEFIQKNMKPYKKLIINFDNESAVIEFEKLIGRKLGCQPSITYPERIIRKVCDKRYYEEKKK